ncbi:MAG: polysaccharide deacetylase family protein [Actinomycetota bacterium]|nr:polysaccharide deacetylase family protein [Actinomycetota bacterium]MDP3631142.1 polysaccharide deacetylase family protein [Actinomycetota bacterium]
MSKGARLEGHARTVVFALLRVSGLPLLARHLIQKHRLTVLLFHQQSPGQFDRTLRILKHRYNFVSLGEALDALEAGDLSRLPDRPLVLTFDDGRASNASLIPVLTLHGVRPTVFIATEVVGTRRHFWWTHLTAGEVTSFQALPDDERRSSLSLRGLDPAREYDEPQALSAAELTALASVADIEPHTRTHPVLTRCTPEQIRDEVEGSMLDVTALVGTRPRVFAYPNGVLSDEVAALVAQCGLRFAVTTEPVLIDEHSDPMRLGRIFVRDGAGASELIVFASGLQGALKRLLRRA